MSNLGDDRGTGTTPPKWWLDEFHAKRAEIEKTFRDAKARGERPQKETLVQLGIDLATKIGRSSGAWNHSAVSNFIEGIRYTREMAEAFSLHYDIPRFETVIRAETRPAALDLEMFLRRFPKPVTPATAARISAVDGRAKALLSSEHDQRRPVDSVDEATDRRRRPRRVTRRS